MLLSCSFISHKPFICGAGIVSLDTNVSNKFIVPSQISKLISLLPDGGKATPEKEPNSIVNVAAGESPHVGVVNTYT